MAEVRIHLEHVGVGSLEGPLEARDVGAAQPPLPFPVQDVDVVVGAGPLGGDLTGPVGGVVIDDQDVRHRERLAGGVQDAGEVLQLVVGGDDDQRAGIV